MTYYDYLIIISSGLGFLMAISLLIRPLTYRNIIFSLLLLVTAYLNLFLQMKTTDSIWNLFIFSFLKISFSMLLGPLIYLYILSITEEKIKLMKKDFLHFLPIIVFSLILILYLCINPSIVDQIENNHAIFLEKRIIFLDTVILITIIYIMIYIFFSIKSIAGRIKSGNPVHFRIMSFLILLYFSLFATITAIASLVLRSEKIFRITIMLVSIVIIFLFLINQRYPYLFMHGAVGINRKKPSKSHLSKVDLQQLNKQLKIIMEKEKFYCDEDLTLKRLSEALEINPHQLSEYLNEHHNKNFNSYVNTYRINEAKDILLKEPNRNALSIAYASGFNSYSAFHTSFKKETGMSPADYRRMKLKNKKKYSSSD